MPHAFWNQPFRMIQPNLRKIDAQNLDVKALVEKVEEYGGNVILANAGGIVSWYDSEIPHQKKNEYLEKDYVQEILTEAHRKGMKVLLRMDVSKQDEDALREHPDWFQYNSEGKLIRHWEMPVTCFNSQYWQEYNFTIVEELIQKYQPDGFFYNSYHFTHCFCERCRNEFRNYSSCELPPEVNWESHLWKQYIQYRYEKLSAYTQKLREFIHARKADAILTIDYFLTGDYPEHLCSAGWSAERMSRSVDLLSPEAFNVMTRPQPRWIYWAGEEARIGKSFGKDIFVLLTYSGIFGSRRSSQPWTQLVFDIMQIAAGGGNPCVALSGSFQQDDRKSLPPIKEVYNYLKENSMYYENIEPLSSTAVYYSQKTMDFYGKGKSRENALFEYRGFYESMTYNHIQFDVLHDGMYDFKVLSRYKTLILPNTACLDSEEASAFDHFVKNGGNLVATYESGLFDKDGSRSMVPLIDCLGFDVKDKKYLSGAYLFINNKEVFKSFKDVDVMALEGEFITAEPRCPEERIFADCFLIPPVKNNTPEFAYFQDVGKEAGLQMISYGKGKVIYVPWEIGKLFHMYGVQEYGLAIANIIDLLNGEREIYSDAPEAVEIRLSRCKCGTVIHFLNAAGKQTKPLTEVIPVYNLTVLVKSEGSKGRSLTTRQELKCERKDAYLKFQVPYIGVYETIVIE
jgi:hypothetical protein